MSKNSITHLIIDKWFSELVLIKNRQQTQQQKSTNQTLSFNQDDSNKDEINKSQLVESLFIPFNLQVINQSIFE